MTSPSSNSIVNIFDNFGFSAGAGRFAFTAGILVGLYAIVDLSIKVFQAKSARNCYRQQMSNEESKGSSLSGRAVILQSDYRNSLYDAGAAGIRDFGMILSSAMFFMNAIFLMKWSSGSFLDKVPFILLMKGVAGLGGLSWEFRGRENCRSLMNRLDYKDVSEDSLDNKINKIYQSYQKNLIGHHPSWYIRRSLRVAPGKGKQVGPLDIRVMTAVLEKAQSSEMTTKDKQKILKRAETLYLEIKERLKAQKHNSDGNVLSYFIAAITAVLYATGFFILEGKAMGSRLIVLAGAMDFCAFILDGYLFIDANRHQSQLEEHAIWRKYKKSDERNSKDRQQKTEFQHMLAICEDSSERNISSLEEKIFLNPAFKSLLEKPAKVI